MNTKDLDKRILLFVKKNEGKPINLVSISFELRPLGFFETDIRHRVWSLIDQGILILNQKRYIRLGKHVW